MCQSGEDREIRLAMWNYSVRQCCRLSQWEEGKEENELHNHCGFMDKRETDFNLKNIYISFF